MPAGADDARVLLKPAMFRVLALDHLVLRIVDVERMLHFYCDTLGCTLERRRDDIGLVQLRAGSALIDLVPVDGKLGRAGGAPPGSEGRNLDHFCLRVEPFDEPSIRESLARNGYEAGPVAQRFGADGEGPSIYVTDPEGNVVELKGPPNPDGAVASRQAGAGMQVDGVDHFVLTVADLDATCDFYSRVLGMRPVTFAGGRRALAFGPQKINLHQRGSEFEPRAASPTPGSGDFCLVTSIPLSRWIPHLERCGVTIVEGPVDKTGAVGPIRSIYFRDPDMNLVEIANYVR